MQEIAESATTHEPEQLAQPRIKRGGKWSRATLALSAAVLAVSCTTPMGSSGSNESPSTERSAITTTTEIVQQPRFVSAEDAVKSADTRSSFLNESGVINLSLLRFQYKDEDFKTLRNLRNGESTSYSESSDTAPVLEVRYDQKAKKFKFDDQTPRGMGDDITYQLLKPIMKDNTVLQAAFELGSVDRIVIRQNKMNHTYPSLNDSHYEYMEDDNTDPDNLHQKTVFIFLPATLSLSQTEYEDALRHEGIHGLTRQYSLKDEQGIIPEQQTQPKPEDVAKWEQVCIDIRNIAVDQAEKYAQETIGIMERGRSLFTNPAVRSLFDEVRNAMRSGDFNRFQPTQEQNISAFGAKIPECKTIGPWGAFVRLALANGIKSLPESDAITNLYTSLQDKWFDILGAHTIFSQLREGTYDDLSVKKRLGHPWDNWDELITTISNVSLGHTKVLAENVGRMSPKDKKTAGSLIEAALSTLDAQLPKDRFSKLHKEIADSRKTLQKAAA